MKFLTTSIFLFIATAGMLFTSTDNGNSYAFAKAESNKPHVFKIDHKYYLSVSIIEYNPDRNAIEVVMRVFTDDLIELLQKRYDVDVSYDAIETAQEKIAPALKKYLDKKFKIKADGADQKLDYLGYEVEEDQLALYIEVADAKAFNTLTVTNQLLMDVYEEQQNLIHVKKGKKRESLLLEKERDTDRVEF